ncbi:MAG: hypothetical protein KJ574_01120 [Nanoarchaeota archaeon]|nr:hypothetical protein [Nanoarchaeota archaeon]
MAAIKKIFTNWKVILLLACLVLAVIAISPNPWTEGVSIRNVAKNSSASLAGIQNPTPTDSPMSRERVLSMNNIPIKTVKDYYDFTSKLEINQSVQIKTTKGFYRLRVMPKIEVEYLDEYENITVEEIEQINRTINGTLQPVNITVNKTVERQKTVEHIVGVQDIGLKIYDAPKTNLRKGLDLAGGTRVLLQPERKLDVNDMDILISNLKERLNVFGLSDVVVREASDLSGNQYILVEIAGANEEEIKDLLARQGKFEAKVGNDTVFKGGKDITYVCRSADCSGIDPRVGCGQSGTNQWNCRFRFTISLSGEAAQRQADITRDLEVIKLEGSEEYLSEKLYLYLDDELVDELNIGADLKGQAATDISISGGGTGTTQNDAVLDTFKNMKRLQTILITGSLPAKLEIMKTDNLSPVLGDEFVRSSLIMGIIAILAVALVVFLRYRRLKIALPMVVVMVSEVVMLLGVAAIISWNLDLAALAGILVAVGTGVDDQIIISDETIKGEKAARNWRERIKRAFFIIIGSYLTMVVAMLPLMFAGTGLLKGFALTSIIGVSLGVFIARPAYAVIVENLLK